MATCLPMLKTKTNRVLGHPLIIITINHKRIETILGAQFIRRVVVSPSAIAEAVERLQQGQHRMHYY